MLRALGLLVQRPEHPVAQEAVVDELDSGVRDGRDAYVVHSHCFTNDIPGLYFYYIVRATMPVWPTTLWLYWDDALGCENSLQTLHRKLDRLSIDVPPRSRPSVPVGDIPSK